MKVLSSKNNFTFQQPERGNDWQKKGNWAIIGLAAARKLLGDEGMMFTGYGGETNGIMTLYAQSLTKWREITWEYVGP